ncbi:MAG: Na+/H+ antiporter NhaA [Propionibacterium sp.]|nr:Na+/H+ antiporter NhaA [Propionibacterium sp.]
MTNTPAQLPGTYRKYSRVEEIFTTSTMSGLLLLIAAALPLIFANSGGSQLYFTVRDTFIGFDFGWLNLRLTVGQWAADGLLAIFFFMVGLELKRQFTIGDLSSRGRALVPMAAAFGGVAVPAIIYTVINWNGPDGSTAGWAIPAATDIAFAVAVLAIIGKHLPVALRTFLLTLAVVDDLIAITIIAIFYTDNLQLGYLAAAIVPMALYWFLATRREHWFQKSYLAAWVLLLPLGIITWALFYNSGIHATVAGVALAFLVPVRSKVAEHNLSETFEHRFDPISTMFALPVFAFFSAGVAIGGWAGLVDSWTSSVALGIMFGLVVGKIIGITGTTWLITRLKGADLDPAIKWVDLAGMSAVAGIGFTVSLLIGELSFATGSPLQDHAKVGVLTASLIAAVLGTIMLTPRNRYYKRLAEAAEQR